MREIALLMVLLVGQSLGEMVTRAAFKLPPQYLQFVQLQPQDWTLPQGGRAASVLSLVYPMSSPLRELEPQPNALTFGQTATHQRDSTQVSKGPINAVTPVNVRQVRRPSYSSFYGFLPPSLQLRMLEPSASLISPFPVYSQTRIQDEKGGYFFSYSGGPSSRREQRDHEGVVKGSYSYVDPHGDLKTYNYIADRNGYRVTSDQVDSQTPQQLNLSLQNVPEFLYRRSKRSSNVNS